MTTPTFKQLLAAIDTIRDFLQLKEPIVELENSVTCINRELHEMRTQVEQLDWVDVNSNDIEWIFERLTAIEKKLKIKPPRKKKYPTSSG